MTLLRLVFLIFCLSFTKELRPVHIFMIGDSTMANKREKDIPEYGWGQVLHYFFNDSIVVDNHARNGRSSKSFIDEGLWTEVVSKIQPGDYLIIQFGHNESKPDTATPILCTSIVRRQFNDDGTLKDTHGDYLIAVRQVAEDYEVNFIDLEAKSRRLIEELGPQKSAQMFLHFDSGIYPLRPLGLSDNTHLSQLGAFRIAGLAVEGMEELNLPLTKFLVNE